MYVYLHKFLTSSAVGSGPRSPYTDSSLSKTLQSPATKTKSTSTITTLTPTTASMRTTTTTTTSTTTTPTLNKKMTSPLPSLPEWTATELAELFPLWSTGTLAVNI